MRTQSVVLASVPILLFAAGCDTQPPTIDGDILGLDLNMVTPTQIVLISGDGIIGTQDPLNQFTLDGGATYQNAWIIAPHPFYHVISGTHYINRNPDFTGPDNTTTHYKTTFSLPSGFSSPSITVQVHADNVATIFLNGTQIGQQTHAEIFPNFQDPPESYTTTTASLFNAGTNNLEFDIYNYGGPTAFDYKAVVSYIAPILVDIDIKPGSYPNCFNINGQGVIPVAILGSADFDVTEINVGSVEFGGLAVRVRGKANMAMCHVEDTNVDGYPDLVCQFEDDDSRWQAGDGTATLIGYLLDGTGFRGEDQICIVP